MFFWFVVSLIGFTIAVTLLTRSIVIPVFVSLFLYCMLNMRERFKEENK